MVFVDQFLESINQATIRSMDSLSTLVAAGALQTQPNFIVIQPDDHYFFDEWTPPGQFDGDDSLKQFPPNSGGLPNINRIREDGIEMKSAYAASPMCGTSRYSTITGRYPSRSSYGRYWDEGNSIRNVQIPMTKLEDMEDVKDANDCSENNIAALLKRNGYQTGVVGKWHLTSDDRGTYTYDRIQNDIRDCGFDFAEAIYKENMWGDWYNDATHNMEHVTSEAIHFIEDAVVDEGKPFFLYFNPTVPHTSAGVVDALESGDCRDTVGGRLSSPPDISYGMTADFDGDCEAYRQSVLDRGGSDDDKMAGAVWIDDAIGSLLQVLESFDIVDNTFILFQLDHGQVAKGSLFEGGSRIAQFVHYPNLFKSGSSFGGLVSTIDIAPTIAELAGIPENQHYSMDGHSWLSEVVDGNTDWSHGNERCVFLEEGMDRSVRCGCYKYILLEDSNGGFTAREARHAGITVDKNSFYYLCDEDTGLYITAPEKSPEIRSASPNEFVRSELTDKIDCHLKRTNPSQDPDYDKKCDRAHGIAPAPTRSPTRSPTLRPTQFEVVSELPTDIFESNLTEIDSNSTEFDFDIYCSDDPEYLYYGEEGQDCQWIIENDRCGREDPETQLHVGKEYCPESCSYCKVEEGCFDNPFYQWLGQEGMNCDRMAENNMCDMELASVNGAVHVGQHYCPESCGYCSSDDEASTSIEVSNDVETYNDIAFFKIIDDPEGV